MNVRIALASVALAASSAVAQQSTGHEGHAPAPTVAAAGKAARPASAVPAVAGARVVAVTARDFAFEMPDTLTAGLTELRLTNLGAELHHVWMVRLEQGKTMRDLFDAMGGGSHVMPAWARDVGGPNAPAPNATTSAAVQLEAGRYAVICVIPSPDGKMHVMKGMAKEIVVVPSKAAPAAAPKADVVMTLSDYDFTVSKPLVAGRQLVRVHNAASQPHEIVLAKLENGKTPMELIAWIDKPQGPPPGIPLGGTTGLAQGAENFLMLDLAPGSYALICFVPDAKDGRPHFLHGMVKQITVAAR